ncbi:TlpA family protein disulfide reductase [Mesoterricola sediminis]|uniref:Thioredoxin domain-containing protein n=1 Tax=Mesoterricola sediminis TaxID=2927980 RepID=A0AA48HHY2_9BACT|nr:TlpA disulfide reductase family protein [Mesoterricola sediminis]BDU78543.1 hypothetical protein METESE_35010 [Mesoterricola sediminis]
MRTHIRETLAAAVGGTVLLAAPPTAPIKPLAIGDPAPALTVKWVKGGPIAAFSPDRMYVVEFWATWCAPCRVAMPHLSELARKHRGRIDFIGVNVWESGYLDKPYEEFLPKVKAFVAEMGDRMDYNVAMDTRTLHMTRQWMEAAGQKGIPASFLVKGGKVVWIGNPMELDEVLAQVEAGTYDMGAAARKLQAEVKRDQELSPQMKLHSQISMGVNSAVEVGNYAKALRLIDEGGPKLGPEFKGSLDAMRLRVYVRSDAGRFLDLGKALKAADPKMGLIVADTVLKVKSGDLDPRVLEAAVEEYQDVLAKGTYSPGLPDALILNWLSIIYDRMGRAADAFASQEKALGLARKGLEAGDGHFTKDLVEGYQATLEAYRKKLPK